MTTVWINVRMKNIQIKIINRCCYWVPYLNNLILKNINHATYSKNRMPRKLDTEYVYKFLLYVYVRHRFNLQLSKIHLTLNSDWETNI